MPHEVRSRRTAVKFLESCLLDNSTHGTVYRCVKNTESEWGIKEYPLRYDPVQQLWSIHTGRWVKAETVHAIGVFKTALEAIESRLSELSQRKQDSIKLINSLDLSIDALIVLARKPHET